MTAWMRSLPLGFAVDPPSLASCWRRSPLAAAASSESQTSATALRAGRTCSTSIAIARIDRAARYSSTCIRSSSKRLGARYLLHRLAGEGWICVGANYRRASDDEFSAPLIDVKKVIAWVHEHGPEYGADPSTIFVAGSSLGAHLASLAACTAGDSVSQPGFESADTSVAGAISLYGYYGGVASGEPPSSRFACPTRNAPPCFVVHGDQDTLVIVEDARGFVEQLRATSSNPVVYAELPGAQHGFDLFRSRRLDTVVDAIEAFTAHIRSARPA